MNDQAGTPRTDPTSNVLELVREASRRLDDLRDMDSRHAKEIADLRADYVKQLADMESSRLDSIRAVDAAARSRADDVAALAATALQSQVLDTKDAAALSLAAALQPMQKDIQELRRNMYEDAGGKVASRDETVERRAQTITRFSGLSLLIAGTGVLVAMILGVTGIVITLLLKG